MSPYLFFTLYSYENSDLAAYKSITGNVWNIQDTDKGRIGNQGILSSKTYLY